MHLTRSLKFFLLLPAMLCGIYLVAVASNGLSDDTVSTLEDTPFPLITLLVVIVLGLLGRFANFPLGRDWRLLAAIPSVCAPSAVFSAWALSSSHLAVVAWGGFGYFIDSLSRFADWGNINSLVLLALMAELCMAFVPVLLVWAYYAAWPNFALLTLALLSVFAYVSLMAELDIYLYWLGLARMEMYGFLLYAPLTHTLAMASVIYLLIKRLYLPARAV